MARHRTAGRSRVKVLALSSYAQLGGGELNLRSLLRARPPEVDASAVVIGDGPLVPELVRVGTGVWSGTRFSGRPSGADVAAFGRGLARILAAERPDVMFAVGVKAAVMAAASRPFLGPRTAVPIVWYKVDFSLDRWLARPLAATVDGVVGVSRAVVESLGPRLTRRRLISVIPPVVDLPADIARDDTGPPMIAAMGTLMPIKGFEHLIRAVAQLATRFPELRTVIGGGDAPAFPGERARLSALAADLGIADRVSLPGFVDATDLLHRSAIYVSATYSDGRYGFEGLSAAMLEASWMGIPVVATRGGGTPEGIIDGTTGMLVSPARPDELASALAGLLSDPDRARGMGAAGRSFAQERFAPEAVASRLFSALTTVGK